MQRSNALATLKQSVMLAVLFFAALTSSPKLSCQGPTDLQNFTPRSLTPIGEQGEGIGQYFNLWVKMLW
jgi:hypothetical protein